METVTIHHKHASLLSSAILLEHDYMRAYSADFVELIEIARGKNGCPVLTSADDLSQEAE